MLRSRKLAVLSVASAIFVAAPALSETATYLPEPFAWNGPYLGGYAVRHPGIAVGSLAGYNQTLGRFVASAEAGFGRGRDFAMVDARLRLGTRIGDNFLAYGAAGIGLSLSGPTVALLVGGGLEFAFAHNRSAYLEAGVSRSPSGFLTTSYVQIGVNWHPFADR